LVREWEGHPGCRAKPVLALICRILLLFSFVLVVAFLGHAWSTERVGSVRDVCGGTLPLTTEVSTFRQIDQVFPSAMVKQGGHVFPLPPAAKPLRDVTILSAGRPLHLDDYLRFNRVAGVLVLKNEQIVLERYGFGNTPQTRWASFSVMKCITSTLAAAALKGVA
jgi:CubicO group peptidase (beta-lactamase class C family)